MYSFCKDCKNRICESKTAKGEFEGFEKHKLLDYSHASPCGLNEITIATIRKGYSAIKSALKYSSDIHGEMRIDLEEALERLSKFNTREDRG
jgi:hypothetical protein